MDSYFKTEIEAFLAEMDRLDAAYDAAQAKIAEIKAQAEPFEAELSKILKERGWCKKVWFSLMETATEKLGRSTDEMLELAAYLYWNCLLLSIKEIEEQTGCRRTRIRKHYPKLGELTCTLCSEVESFCLGRRDQGEAYWGLCKACDKARKEVAKEERKAEQRASNERWRREQKAREDQAEERLEKLKTMPYDEYLQSEHWGAVRKRAYRKAGWKCSLCGNDGKLHCHHRDYERRGEERPNDVTVLCGGCHRKFHNIALPKTDF